MISLRVHIANSEPITVEVDAMPGPNDTLLLCKNMRDNNERELSWIDEGVRMIYVPVWRINYIQVLPASEEQEEFPLLFRND